MKYAETKTMEAGLRFKSASGLIVETTGTTAHIENTGAYAHEVKIVEGEFTGETFLHNLDYAELFS